MGKITLKELQRRIDEVRKRNKRRREANAKKRESRRKRDRGDFVLGEPIKGKARPRSREVWKLFNRKLREIYGDNFIVPPWTVAQKTLAVKLVDIYGFELVEKAVDFLFLSWDDICTNSGGKVSGVPTINFMWAIRERLFADVQKGLKRFDKLRLKKGFDKDSDEWIGSDGPVVGWD